MEHYKCVTLIMVGGSYIDDDNWTKEAARLACMELDLPHLGELVIELVS